MMYVFHARELCEKEEEGMQGHGALGVWSGIRELVCVAVET